MVGHQMPFFDPAFLAPGTLVKYISQLLPDLTKKRLLAVFRREHDVVLALLCRMVQVIMILRDCDLLEGPCGSLRRSCDLATSIPQPLNGLYSLRHSGGLAGEVRAICASLNFARFIEISLSQPWLKCKIPSRFGPAIG